MRDIELQIDDDDREEVESRRLKGRFQRDRHLSTALLLDEIEFFNKRESFENLSRVDRLFLKELQAKKRESSNNKILITSANTELLPVLFQHCVLGNFDEIIFENEENELYRYIEISRYTTELQYNHFIKNPNANFNIHLEKFPILIYLFYLRKQLNFIVESFYSDSIFQVTSYQFCNYKFTLYGSKMIIENINTLQTFFCPYSSFLCLNDIITGRFTTLLSVVLKSNVYSSNNDLITPVQLINIWQMGDKDLEIFKNEAFNSFKIFHAVVVSLWLQKNDKYSSRNRVKRLTKDIPNRCIWNIKSYLSEMNHHCFLSLTGMRNHWGHPIIDPKKGIEKVRKNGEMAVEGLFERTKEVNLFGKHYFINNYVMNHKHWPQLNIDDLPRLKEYHDNNIIVPDEQFLSLREEYEKLIFYKTYPLLPDLEVYSLLKDSAIAPLRHDWHEEFSPIVKKDKKFKMARIPTNRRAIIDFLMQEQINISEIIQELNQNGKLALKYYFAVLTFKERELSITGRLFVKLTPLVRYLQTYVEHLMASFILKEIPCQTMTKSYNQTVSLLHGFSSKLYGGNYKNSSVIRYISVSNDFASWNLRFQEGNTFMFNMFDQLHESGVLFSHIHEFTRHLLILGKCPYEFPDLDSEGNIIPNFFMWEGQSSFFEGMRQKCWTFITIVALFLFCLKRNIKIELVAQGDNQLMLVKLPHYLIELQNNMSLNADEEIHKYMEKILNQLEEDFGQINHTLKQEECWYSSQLCEYGRELYLNGVKVPTYLKEIFRIHPLLNDNFPSIPSELSSISSSCLSACQTSTDPLITYCVSLIEVLIYLEKKIEIKRMPDNMISILLCGDASFGFFPISQLSHFLMRGIEDPITQSISLFQFIFDNFPEHRLQITKMLTFRIPSKEYSLLLIDPFCLNLNFPTRPEATLRNMVLRSLPRITNNKVLLDAFKLLSPQKIKSFIEQFLTLQPFNPKIMQHVVNSSNLGIASHVVNMFTNTRSVAKLCDNQRYDYMIRYKIEMMNKQYLNSLMNQFVNRKVEFQASKFSRIFNTNLDCSYEIGKFLRNKTWGIPIEGITKPSVLDQTKYEFRSNLPPRDILKRSIVIEIDPTLHSRTTRKGKFPIYLTSETKEKIKTRYQNLSEVPDYFMNIKRLLVLWSWFKCPNLRRLFEHMIIEKCSTDIKEILKLAPLVLANDVAHRLQELFPGSAANFNGDISITSFLKYHTTQGTDFARFGINYQIYFQLAFTYGTALIDLNKDKLSCNDKYLILNFECPHCTQLTYQGSYTLPQEFIYDSIILTQKNYSIEFQNNPICTNPTNSQIKYHDLEDNFQLSNYLAASIFNWLEDERLRSFAKNDSTISLPIPSYIASIPSLRKANIVRVLISLGVRLIKQIIHWRSFDLVKKKFIKYIPGLMRLKNTIYEAGQLGCLHNFLSSFISYRAIEKKFYFENVMWKFIKCLYHCMLRGTFLQGNNKYSLLTTDHDNYNTKRYLSALFESGFFDCQNPYGKHDQTIHSFIFNDELLISGNTTLNNDNDFGNINFSRILESICLYMNMLKNIGYIRNSSILIKYYSGYENIFPNLYPYYLMAKKASLNTTSFSKFSMLPISPRNSIVLGDGDGGTSLFLEKYYNIQALHVTEFKSEMINPAYAPPIYLKFRKELKEINFDLLYSSISLSILDTSFSIPSEFFNLFMDIIIDIDFDLNNNYEHFFNQLYLVITQKSDLTIYLKVNNRINPYTLNTFIDLINQLDYTKINFHQNICCNIDIEEQIMIITNRTDTIIPDFFQAGNLSIDDLRIPNIHPFCSFCIGSEKFNSRLCPTMTPKKFLHYLIKTNDSSIHPDHCYAKRLLTDIRKIIEGRFTETTNKLEHTGTSLIWKPTFKLLSHQPFMMEYFSKFTPNNQQRRMKASYYTTKLNPFGD